MLTSPRQTLRDEVKNLLEAVVDVPVMSGRARDLPPRTRSAVLVYVPRETLQRLDDRPLAPVQRSMSLEIVILSEGGDENASDDADRLSRLIELALSEDYPHAAPVGSETAYDANGKAVKTLIVMTYAVEIMDEMGA